MKVTSVFLSLRFARVALGAYPKRLGIEVGTWLTQKGYFRRGRDLINVRLLVTWLIKGQDILYQVLDVEVYYYFIETVLARKMGEKFGF